MLPPNDDNIMVNASQTHGSSGSPFLDSMGRVIGVLTSGSENVAYLNVVPKERAINFTQQYRNEKKFTN